MKNLIRTLVRSTGFDLVRYSGPPKLDVTLPPDLREPDRIILRKIASYSMTSSERQICLIDAVRYIVKQGIAGCYVECGVWRGGSSMATALTLMQEGESSRHLHLFDTYEGMTPPTASDKTTDGVTAQKHLERDVTKTGYWCIAGIEDVQQNMKSTGYPQDHIHYVKGPVEVTIPSHAAVGPIALLRLDTDWYESTKHELLHLFPLLVDGGILIIDDYGHWEGARQAVDEYFAALPKKYFMHRMDYTARMLFK